MRAFVTGASGFVGAAVVQRLLRDRRWTVRAGVRGEPGPDLTGVDVRQGDLASDMNWGPSLEGVDGIIHLAGRVHVMRESAVDPLTVFRRINVAGTLHLARQAADAGVRRFVFVSSVKVNGESGSFTETDPVAPADAYGISKLEAEAGLRVLAGHTGMEVVIVRPPLVYGPGVRANFQALIQAVARGIPLPLGAIHNRRSLVALDNLVDGLVTCLDHPAAANEIFFVSDGEDLSTTDLVRRLARAMDRPARLIPVPAAVLLATATLLGRGAAARRLVGTLCVNSTKAQRLLSWTPPIDVNEGLRRTVAAYRRHR